CSKWKMAGSGCASGCTRRWRRSSGLHRSKLCLNPRTASSASTKAPRFSRCGGPRSPTPSPGPRDSCGASRAFDSDGAASGEEKAERTVTDFGILGAPIVGGCFQPDDKDMDAGIESATTDPSGSRRVFLADQLEVVARLQKTDCVEAVRHNALQGCAGILQSSRDGLAW